MCALSIQAEDGIRDYKVTGVQTCALLIQAEDGIRDYKVTGVQTCALPISEIIGSGIWKRSLGTLNPSPIARHMASWRFSTRMLSRKKTLPSSGERSSSTCSHCGKSRMIG